MKKSLITMGLAVAAFSFAGCNKVEPAGNNLGAKGGQYFEIVANASATKTENDGLDTKWSANDALTVFHAVSGSTTYGSNDKFTIVEGDVESGTFKGELTEELESDKSYDWYAIYPYNVKYTTPANTTCYQQIANKQTQVGYGSTAHLAGNKFPLVGKVKSVAGNAKPNITMNQVCAVIKLEITNNSGEDLTITSASVTSENVNLAGGYFIDFSGDKAVLVDENEGNSENDKYMFKTVNLTVNNGDVIADGETASLYIGVKPFVANDEIITISVNGYEKPLEIPAHDVKFEAGKIKTISFNYDKEQNVDAVAEGNYAIMTKRENGNYWIMSCDLGTASTKRFQASDTGLTKVPESIETKAANIWAVTKSGNGYILTSKDGKQITWSSGNSADLADEGKVLTIAASASEVGAYNVSFAASETATRVLALNGIVGNDYFAFYSGSQRTELYFVPATAAAVTLYDITVSPTTNGTVTVSQDQAESGETITVTVTPAEGYELSTLTYNGNDIKATKSFTMPAEDVTIAASFSVKEDGGTSGSDSDKVLTFALSSNPGGWPTVNSTTLTDYTYSLDETAYTFSLKNVKCNSGYLMLTQPAVLGLPAIEGYKLTKVVAANSAGCSTSVKVGVSSSDSTESYITGGDAQTWSTQKGSYTYNLTNTVANTVYYLYVTSKNAQITELELTYSPVSQETEED